MDINEHIDYWIKTADEDLAAADTMFITGKYNWCLFIGHLVLEKTLKAHFVLANNDVPPKTHDLVRLSKKTNLVLTEEQIDILERVNSFNMEARYPEEKFSFYKQCTKEYTELNFNQIKELFQWLKSNLKY
jgi:HEPN domain-containing protein